jgi:hypothetical protein
MNMAMVVTLRTPDGFVIRKLPDPSGGTFDAAGDFDDLLGQPDQLPVLAAIDPYEDTIVLATNVEALLADIEAALLKSQPGPQQRGLLRLREMARRCRDGHHLTLVFQGD